MGFRDVPREQWPESKTCSKCGAEKPLSQFPVHSRALWERGARCNQCKRDIFAEWYVRVGKERQRAKGKSRRGYEWFVRNADKLNERRRARYAAGMRTAELENRRASKRAAAGSGITSAQWSAILAEHDNRCAYCLKQYSHLGVDHVIPLSRGGEHDVSNIVPACTSCNSSKNDRGPIDILLCPNLLVTRRMLAAHAGQG